MKPLDILQIATPNIGFIIIAISAFMFRSIELTMLGYAIIFVGYVSLVVSAPESFCRNVLVRFFLLLPVIAVSLLIVLAMLNS